MRRSWRASWRLQSTWRARCMTCTSSPGTRNSGGVQFGASRTRSTSAFKELDPIPQFKATAKLGEFLESRLSQSFQLAAVPAGPAIFYYPVLPGRRAESSPLIPHSPFMVSLRMADHSSRASEFTSKIIGCSKGVTFQLLTHPICLTRVGREFQPKRRQL